MFSRKKIAAVSGFLGGLTLAFTGVAQAAAADPGVCTQDLLGGLSCSQRITGVIPEDGTIPHQENCEKVQPVIVPAALGNGRVRLGPEVTCSPTTQGVPPETDRDLGPLELPF
jgi:hypothetical protein